MKLAGSEGEVDNIGDCGNKYGWTFFKKPGRYGRSQESSEIGLTSNYEQHTVTIIRTIIGRKRAVA